MPSKKSSCGSSKSLLKVPHGIDIVQFVKNDGVVEESPEPAVVPVSFADFRGRYLATHGNGSMESNSLGTVRIHLSHIGETLGERFPMTTLQAAHLQKHITRRSAMKGLGGKRLSPTTIRKELASFRAAWNWGVHMGIVSGFFPNKGLVFPKTEEKPPFMTWTEIDRRIRKGRLGEHGQAELWDALFLTLPEIDELLDHVNQSFETTLDLSDVRLRRSYRPRRSEMIRAQVEDVDFDGGSILIREKKRSKGQRTTRRSASHGPTC